MDGTGSCETNMHFSDSGGLPFTQKFWKFRLERKCKVYLALPKRKISGENGIVVQNSQTEFPDGKWPFHLLISINF